MRCRAFAPRGIYVRMTHIPQITDKNLNELATFDKVVRTEKKVLDAFVKETIKTQFTDRRHRMGEWCQKQHTLTGLIDACLQSKDEARQVAQEALDFVKRFIPEKGAGTLAGSSVHADRRFMMRDLNQDGWGAITDHLSYRLVDVSTLDELRRRWCPEVSRKPETLANEIVNEKDQHRSVISIISNKGLLTS